MNKLDTVHLALTWARATLLELETPALDAECLLAHVLQQPRSWLWAHPDAALTTTQQQQYQALVQQRQQQIPLAYLTQTVEFWSLSLLVTPDVLIPRPETEHVIERACDLFPDKTQTIACLELGTGSGAIAVALATERPQWNITAIDQSAEALAIAKQNAQQHHCETIDFQQSNWFSQLSGQQFNCIVSNPPYLASDDPYLDTSIKYEPQAALVSGKSGLEAYIDIISQVGDFLLPGGVIILEHGQEQHDLIAKLLIQNGFQHIQQSPDLQGISRVISAKMS